MTDSDLLLTDDPGTASTSIENRVTTIVVRSDGNQRLSICHPNRFLPKLLALILMCLLGFGSTFCYDNPGALENYFKDMNYTTSEFVALYSWYSWPNVILCFFGGFLMDKYFGIRFGTCLYALLVVFGQLIFAYGVYVNTYWIAILGRFIFGIGGEPLAVAQNNYAVLWFKGQVLNMVFGFQLSIARTGSAVNFLLMEPLYKHVSEYYTGYQCLGITLFVASLPCFLSFFSSVLLGAQDKHAERVLNRETSQSSEMAKITDALHFPLTFWLTTFSIVFYYSAIFSFIALGKDFFEKEFDLKPPTANFINSLSYLIAAIFSPFLGLIIDKVGKNLSFVTGSLILTVIGHLMLTYRIADPLISMCLVGFSYAMIASALWPLIAFVTPEHLLGTAYGIAQSFENLGLGVVQAIAGKIVDNYGYIFLEIYFISCFCVALLMVTILWIHDASHNGCLNMTSKQRTAFHNNQTIPADQTEKERLLDSDYGSSEDEQTNASKNFKNSTDSEIGAIN